MIRKFKLLKEIPGLDKKVGDIITLSVLDKLKHEVCYDPATRPDLWEEIKEKKVNKTDTYKLIKCYPGSPELGSIFIKREAYEAIFYLGKKQNSDKWQINLPIDIVENNPEFWQKVEEKDFEILKTAYLEGGKNEIIAVIRKSDGEIFTVGDKTNAGIIKNIEIIEDKIFLCT